MCRRCGEDLDLVGDSRSGSRRVYDSAEVLRNEKKKKIVKKITVKRKLCKIKDSLIKFKII